MHEIFSLHSNVNQIGLDVWQGMFTDIDRSQKLLADFDVHAREHSIESLVAPQVLTMGFWPNAVKDPKVRGLDCPETLLRC